MGPGGAGLAGVAGLSSPTAGSVDTTEWPLERELGQCGGGEARQPPCHPGHLKATTDCGCCCCRLGCRWALPAPGSPLRISSKETQVRQVFALRFLVCVKLMSYGSVDTLPWLSDRRVKTKKTLIHFGAQRQSVAPVGGFLSGA